MAGPRIFHYDAFISYRHAELDKTVAVGLHRRLESFRVPGGLRKNLPADKRHIQRVFRDQDELPLSSNLSDSIELALQNTDWLIVIATPRFPQSKWCAQEIVRFTELYGQDNILVVLAEGTPEESIPEELRFRQNGAVDEIIADVRPGAGGSSLKKLLDKAALRITARILGLKYDELRRKVRERRVRRIFAACLAAAAIFNAFGVYCAAQLVNIRKQRDLITEQHAELQEQYHWQQQKYAESMAVTAKRMAGRGKRLEALYALMSTLRTGEGDAAVSLSAPVEERLVSLLGVYERNTLFLQESVPVPPYEDEDFWEWDKQYHLMLEYDFLMSYVGGMNDIAGVVEREDGTIWLVTTTGKHYLYDPARYILDDVSSIWFSEPPESNVNVAVWKDDTLYMAFQGSEETFSCYRWTDTDVLEQAGTIPRTDIPSVRLNRLEREEEILSDDGRYRLRLGEGDCLCIFEGENTEPSKIFYDVDYYSYGVFGMEAMEGTGYYMIVGNTLNSWLLNPELEVIARIQGYIKYDPERKAFLQMKIPLSYDDLNEQDEYQVFYQPLKSGEELVKEAEKQLGDFRPSGEFLERYGIPAV